MAGDQRIIRRVVSVAQYDVFGNAVPDPGSRLDAIEARNLWHSVLLVSCLMQLKVVVQQYVSVKIRTVWHKLTRRSLTIVFKSVFTTSF